MHSDGFGIMPNREAPSIELPCVVAEATFINSETCLGPPVAFKFACFALDREFDKMTDPIVISALGKLNTARNIQLQSTLDVVLQQ